PDVMSVCHHHAPAMMPYAIARAAVVPVFHLGASMGLRVPFWDSRDDFGSTALVLTKPEEGRSLAKALGQGWMVLMGRHGATVAGTSIRQTVFRSIYSCKNAELQTQARLLGHVEALDAQEVELAAAYNLRPGPQERAWDYWAKRVQDAEAVVAAGKAALAKPASASASRPAAKAKKPAAKAKRRKREPALTRDAPARHDGRNSARLHGHRHHSGAAADEARRQEDRRRGGVGLSHGAHRRPRRRRLHLGRRLGRRQPVGPRQSARGHARRDAGG